ncbi:hypothetical protein JXB41_03525 [Candidatus Woesearchaeota archaeon]|nr:hypothetical protein [Candidatus Woesearchaeota archaeon]
MNKKILIAFLIVFSMVISGCCPGGGCDGDEDAINEAELKEKLVKSSFYINNLKGSKVCNGGYVLANEKEIPITAAHCTNLDVAQKGGNDIGNNEYGFQIEGASLSGGRVYFRIGCSFIKLDYDSSYIPIELKNNIYTGGFDLVALTRLMWETGRDTPERIRSEKNVPNSLSLTSDPDLTNKLYYYHIGKTESDSELREIDCSQWTEVEVYANDPSYYNYKNVVFNGNLDNKLGGVYTDRRHMIKCKGYSQGGDSGSVIIDSNGNAVSILLEGIGPKFEEVDILNPYLFYLILSEYSKRNLWNPIEPGVDDWMIRLCDFYIPEEETTPTEPPPTGEEEPTAEIPLHELFETNREKATMSEATSTNCVSAYNGCLSSNGMCFEDCSRPYPEENKGNYCCKNKWYTPEQINSEQFLADCAHCRDRETSSVVIKTALA